MTDTLAKYRRATQFTDLVDTRFGTGLRCGHEAGATATVGASGGVQVSEYGLPVSGPYVNRSCNTGQYVNILDPYETLYSTAVWAAGGPEGTEFAGLAAFLVLEREQIEIAPNAVCVIPEPDDDWAFPVMSGGFERAVTDWLVPAMAVPASLRPWADHTMRLAAEILPANVPAPQRVFDPEVEGEWWIAIKATCHGSVDAVLQAYDELVDRFVMEVPTDARFRIKIEIEIAD